MIQPRLPSHDKTGAHALFTRSLKAYHKTKTVSSFFPFDRLFFFPPIWHSKFKFSTACGASMYFLSNRWTCSFAKLVLTICPELRFHTFKTERDERRRRQQHRLRQVRAQENGFSRLQRDKARKRAAAQQRHAEAEREAARSMLAAQERSANPSLSYIKNQL